MHIKSFHPTDKSVAAKSIFKAEEGNVVAIQILKGQQLKEHLTKVPAFLVCIEGEVVFENEKGFKQTLKTGEFVNIEPMVKHWVDGQVDSQLILIK